MQAVFIADYGGPEVLQHLEAALPKVQDDEILVQICCAGVSPFDCHVREGWYRNSPNYVLPIILGWELSGIVAAIGKQVTRFKIGDAVFAHPSVYHNGGAYAEYAAVKEKEAAYKPDIISHTQAAAASMNALTAWQALFDIAQLSAGQRVLIHAAAGGVGHLAVQLAKWKGAEVIGTASAKNRQFLVDLGVDQIIDYQSEHFEDQVKDVDAVLDTLGGEVLMKSFNVMKKNGIVVSIVDFDNIKKADQFGVRGETCIVSPNANQLATIAELLVAGKLKAQIENIFPLVEVQKAHRLLETGHVRGKIILSIQK